MFVVYHPHLIFFIGKIESQLGAPWNPLVQYCRDVEGFQFGPHERGLFVSEIPHGCMDLRIDVRIIFSYCFKLKLMRLYLQFSIYFGINLFDIFQILVICLVLTLKKLRVYHVIFYFQLKSKFIFLVMIRYVYLYESNKDYADTWFFYAIIINCKKYWCLSQSLYEYFSKTTVRPLSPNLIYEMYFFWLIVMCFFSSF